MHGTAVGTFGVAAADGVGVNEQVEWMSGLRKRHLFLQMEGLLGCCLARPASEALAPSFAFDALDSGQASSYSKHPEVSTLSSLDQNQFQGAH